MYIFGIRYCITNFWMCSFFLYFLVGGGVLQNVHYNGHHGSHMLKYLKNHSVHINHEYIFIANIVELWNYTYKNEYKYQITYGEMCLKS